MSHQTSKTNRYLQLLLALTLLAGLLLNAPLPAAQASALAWYTAGAMGTARYGHTATLLPTGQVLVAGGYGGGAALPSAELFNPAKGVWSASAATAPLTCVEGRRL